jgi:hypothetical protein
MIYRTREEQTNYYMRDVVTTKWTIIDIEHEWFPMDRLL